MTMAGNNFAGGGIPTSEALSPWYARSEERQMVQPEGLIRSAGAGRTDIHPINVPSGSYVLPADVVSGLGEGSSLAGSSVVDKMMHSNPYGIEGGGGRRGGMGIPRPPAPYNAPQEAVMESRGGSPKGKNGDGVPIVIAGGEFLVHPQTIIQKFGSLKKGHQVLDKFVIAVRKKTIDDMKKLKGPKK